MSLFCCRLRSLVYKTLLSGSVELAEIKVILTNIDRLYRPQNKPQGIYYENERKLSIGVLSQQRFAVFFVRPSFFQLSEYTTASFIQQSSKF